MDQDGGLESWYWVGGNMPMCVDMQRTIESRDLGFVYASVSDDWPSRHLLRQ